MTLLDALNDLFRLPLADAEDDDMPSAYLAGYVDAKVELREKWLTLSKQLDANLYYLQPTPTGFTLVRANMESLHLDPASAVPAHRGDPAPPDPDQAF